MIAGRFPGPNNPFLMGAPQPFIDGTCLQHLEGETDILYNPLAMLIWPGFAPPCRRAFTDRWGRRRRLLAGTLTLDLTPDRSPDRSSARTRSLHSFEVSCRPAAEKPLKPRRSDY